MNQRKFMVSTRRLAMMLIMALGSSLMAFAASAENSIQAVQQQGHQLRTGQILLRKNLRRLGKVSTQGQLGQLPTQGRKQFQGGCLVDGVLSPIFK